LYAFAARANCFFMLGDIHGAIRDFRSALQANPASSESYYNLGNAEHALGHWEESITMYTRALAIDENLADAFNNRANAYKHLGANVKAIEDLTRALQVKYPPLSPAQHLAYTFNRGDAYFKEERFFEAMEDFTRSLQVDPKHSEALAMRAASQVGRARHLEGITDAKAALAIEPSCTLALRWRGQAFFETKQYAEAMQDLDRCVELCEQAGEQESQESLMFYAEARYARGVVRDVLGEEEGAREDFFACAPTRVDLFEKDAERHEMSVDRDAENEKKRKMDFEIAMASEKIANLTPDFEMAYVQRGAVYLRLGEYAKALADLQKQYDSEPGTAVQAFTLSGEVYVEQLRYDDAMAMFTAALQLNPKQAGAVIGRGVVYLMQGDLDAAMGDAKAAISIAFSSARAHGLKACVLFKQGETRAALTEFDSAVALDRTDPWLFFWRRQANFAVQQYAQAFADYHAAVELDPRYGGRTGLQVLRDCEGLSDLSGTLRPAI